MKTSQTKFLEEFDKLAEKYKLELNVNKGASNVGQGIFMMKDWTTILSFTFNFQSGYCAIKFYRPGAPISDSTLIKSYSMLYYTEHHTIREMFKWVDQWLNKYLTVDIKRA